MNNNFKMEELIACRLCLATDTTLTHIHQTKVYENIMALLGYSIEGDGLPHHLCSTCLQLLYKYRVFRNRCAVAQHVLNNVILEGGLVTMTFLRNVDRVSSGLASPLQHSRTECYEFNPQNDLETEKIEPNMKIEEVKIETAIYTPNVSDYEDDQPLINQVNDTDSKKVFKKKASTKKVVKDEFSTVIYLSKEQQMNEVILRKNSMNYNNSPYKCDKCFKGFLEKNTFVNHMEKHDPCSGSFICDICQIRCQTKKDLRSHLIAVHERRYSCNKCQHISNTKTQAKEHDRWHEGHTYRCEYCGLTYRKLTTYLTHLRRRHPSDVVCSLCGESFLSEHGLTNHTKRMHKPRGREKYSNVVSNRHCSECNIRFGDSAAYKKHLITSVKHNENSANSESCVKCGDSFPNDSLLSEHMNVHRDPSVQCDRCQATFPTAMKCVSHYRRVHMGIKVSKNMVCEVCGKKCTSKATLSYHQRTHTGEKPYRCSVCGKCFSVKQRLQIHGRTHTDERPYGCGQCSKAFRHKAALNRHSRVHSGIKPYSCSYCTKSFSQSNSMKMHIHTVHLKLPPPYRNKKLKSTD